MEPISASAMAAGAGVSSLGNIFSSALSWGLNKKSASKQRAWEEYMANTAHQREVKDLRAAGLNPILSATGGSGAPTPSYSRATFDSPDLSRTVESGLAAAASASQLKAVQATSAADEAKGQNEVIKQGIIRKVLESPLGLLYAFPKSSAAAIGGIAYTAKKLLGHVLGRPVIRPIPGKPAVAIPGSRLWDFTKGSKAASSAKAGAAVKAGASKKAFGFNPLMLMLMLEDELRASNYEKAPKDLKRYMEN